MTFVGYVDDVTRSFFIGPMDDPEPYYEAPVAEITKPPEVSETAVPVTWDGVVLDSSTSP